MHVRFALAVAMLVAVPAAAHHDGTNLQPTVRTERTYITCVDGAKVQNQAALEKRFPTWSTTPPSRSMTEGAGCGHYENFLSVYPPHPAHVDLVWQGPFKGNLDVITVEAHNIYVGSARALGVFPMDAALYIDGVKVYESASPLSMKPERSATGVSEKFLLTFRGLNYLEEHGDGETERTVTVVLMSYNEHQNVWVWDTREVPAGLTFNPPNPSGHIINVNRRD